MTEKQTYNGWENKPTWLIKLWIDNSQGDQDYWREVCTEIINDTIEDISDIDEEDKRHAVYQIEQRLKDEFENGGADILESSTAGVSSFWSDLLGWALAMVNWLEVAGALYDDAMEDIEYNQ